MALIDRRELEAVIDTPSINTGLFKKGKFKATIIYEDGSYLEFFIRLKKIGTISIRKKTYIINPERILRGKVNQGFWGFGNPIQYDIPYFPPTLSALDFNKNPDKLSETERKTKASMIIDSESLERMRSNNILNMMFASKGLTMKAWLLIIGGILVFLIIIIVMVLHFTGVIDIKCMLGACPAEAV